MTVDKAPSTPTAREDWEQRISTRSGRAATDGRPRLPAPAGVRAERGDGQVTVSWDPVDGAVGYLVQRADADGAFVTVDHHGDDVLAVPFGAYADTTSGWDARGVRYRVVPVVDVDTEGEPSADVTPTDVATPGAVDVHVTADRRRTLPRPWRPMIGSEHLSHLLCTDTTGGRVIGTELAEALALVRDIAGVTHVRAHAILCDDLGVYTEVDGEPVHDFAGIDRVYDRLRAMNLRPVVELGFMPAALASDPDHTVFDYDAITSPPKDWDRWENLIGELTRHVVDRYGIDEVLQWSFEVWNEPNLEIFWSGTPEEYFRLYDISVRAIRAVDKRLVVGGPSTAAAGWVESLLDHVAGSGTPVDFVSTHVYGNAPLDFRPALSRAGRDDAQIWWTEWGPTPTHFNPVGDGPMGAAFLLRGMKSASGRIDALSHWVASDHFEELGRPPALAHGGFGLLSVGNLRKPRFWALALLDRLGDDELTVALTGDGGGSLIESVAARDADGTVRVLVWNATLNQEQVHGDATLGRHVNLAVDGIEGQVTVEHHRLDLAHTNVLGRWNEMRDGADWPTDAQWQQLADLDALAECEPARALTADGTLTLGFELPMPGVSAVTIRPA